MILDIPEEHYWVFIVPSYKSQELGYKTEEEFLKHHGKWLIYGSKARMEELAFELDPYIDVNLIEKIKYSKKEPSFDPLPNEKSYVMCVYCDDREKNFIRNILSSIGVNRVYWKYDRQTIEDWSEKGKLTKEARKSGATFIPENY